MTGIEDDLRRTLRGPSGTADTEGFLADVHRGARRRRQRRAVGVMAAVVLAVAGAATALVPGAGPDAGPPVATTSATPSQDPSATTEPSPSPTPPAPSTSATPTFDNGAPATTGVTGYDVAAGGSLWRVTDEPCDTVLCSRVASYDGNGGWTTRADIAWPDAANATPEDGGPVQAVTVSPDGQDLWAYGREVWSSHDAGRTWVQDTLPPGTARVAEIAVSGGEALLRTSAGTLLRSPVAADSWTSAALPNGMDYSEQVLGLGDTLVVRGRTTAMKLLVATSNNGGDTWTVSPGPCDPEQPAFTVAEGSVFAICPAGDGSPTAGTDVMRSDDQGRTWTTAVTLAPTKASASVLAIVPVQKTSAYLVSGSGEALVFPEGEKQYADALTLSPDQMVFEGGRFVSPEHGYLRVGLPRRLLETTDGGQTWRRIG